MPFASCLPNSELTVADASILQRLLEDRLPTDVVLALVDAFTEIKRNSRLGGHRLAAIEGGRFCEATYRTLEYMTSGTYTAFGSTLNTQKITQNLAQTPSGSHPDSVRLHIPRTLRVIYDIRNKRDAAHLCDDIDANTQDSSLIVACASWIMAELVRLSRAIDPDEASMIINDLVTRDAPSIQYFDGRPRVLGNQSAGDTCLLLLYSYRGHSVTVDQLKQIVRPSMRSNLNRTLQRLDDQDLIHRDSKHIWITYPGETYVEQHGLAGET